jgi:hypothetical protein
LIANSHFFGFHQDPEIPGILAGDRFLVAWLGVAGLGRHFHFDCKNVNIQGGSGSHHLGKIGPK